MKKSFSASGLPGIVFAEKSNFVTEMVDNAVCPGCGSSTPPETWTDWKDVPIGTIFTTHGLVYIKAIVGTAKTTAVNLATGNRYSDTESYDGMIFTKLKSVLIENVD